MKKTTETKSKSGFKKIFSKITAVITALSFIFGLLVFVSVLKVKNGEVPGFLGFSVLEIYSGSMTPEYPINTIVIVKKVDAGSLKVGDVISFYSVNSEISGATNTHRIKEIRYSKGGGRVFVTKGDANDLPDEDMVYQDKIVGKVVYSLGAISGSALNILKNKNVIFFLIIVPLILITFSEAVNLVNLAMGKDDEEEEIDDEKHIKNKKN